MTERRGSAVVEKAVKALQLYMGSTGCNIRDAQKLYRRYMAAVARVAKAHDMDELHASDQITQEARRRGPILPLPGKDI